MARAMPEFAVSGPPQAATTPSAPRRNTAWGWLPTAVVATSTVALLLSYGVSAGDLARFAAYLGLALALPGTLLWRALRGGPGLLAADVAAGTVVGYAIEVLTYIPARAVGAPLLALAVPAGLTIAFLAVPGLRRFWRGSGERAPAGWSWAVAAGAAFMVVWSAASFYREHGLTEPANTAPYLDMPYHLALAGEIKHHMPPITPYVRGEPLHYHWFFYADAGATSWATGIELETLIYRLSVLPMLVLITVLIAVLARTITGRWWTGPVALGITYFAVAPTPYGWIEAAVSDASMISVLWVSPTQTFGTMIFLPVVLLLVELLRGEPERPVIGRWVLFTLLLAALTGAKATILPVLAGGLVIVVLGHLVARRRLHRPALAALGLTILALAFAQLVLFNGSARGLMIDPLAIVRRFPVVGRTGLTDVPGGLAVGLAVSLVCWACIWAGAFGLLRRRAALADPAHLLCLGLGAAGIGGALVFAHLGLAQMYFFMSARPYLSLVAAAGLAVALPEGEPRPRTFGLLAAVGLTGAGAVFILRTTGDGRLPTAASAGGDAALLATVAWPYVALLAFVGLVAFGVVLARRRRPAIGHVGLAVVLALATGFALYGVRNRYLSVFGEARHTGWYDVVLSHRDEAIPAGAVAAGRWVRDHSSPNDLVATNAHCRTGPTKAPCDSRHFWVSGYTERRVLLEGWAYSDSAHVNNPAAESALQHARTPFWDARLFADNDAAFQQPSAATIGRLRDGYGVRWLLVDMRFAPPPAGLDAVAAARFRAADCAVYELI